MVACSRGAPRFGRVAAPIEDCPGAMAEMIAIAADHGGYDLKTLLIPELAALGFEVLDLGTKGPESVDYPDFAEALARAIETGQAKRGVLICGTGIGIAIAANRHRARPRRASATTRPRRGSRASTTTPTCWRWAPACSAPRSPRIASRYFSAPNSRAGATPGASPRCREAGPSLSTTGYQMPLNSSRAKSAVDDGFFTATVAEQRSRARRALSPRSSAASASRSS